MLHKPSYAQIEQENQYDSTNQFHNQLHYYLLLNIPIVGIIFFIFIDIFQEFLPIIGLSLLLRLFSQIDLIVVVNSTINATHFFSVAHLARFPH